MTRRIRFALPLVALIFAASACGQLHRIHCTDIGDDHVCGTLTRAEQ